MGRSNNGNVYEASIVKSTSLETLVILTASKKSM